MCVFIIISMLLSISAAILIYHFQRGSAVDVSHPWKSEKFTYFVKEIEDFSKNYNFFSSRPIIGKVSNKKEDLDETIRILKVIYKDIKEPKKQIVAVSEILTKVLAYRDLKENTVVPIPIITKMGKCYLVDYIVDRAFDIYKGMPAYGLIPSDYKKEAAPILLFRGTDCSATRKRGWVSLISDLDPSGPGYRAYLKSKDDFRKWLLKVGEDFSHKPRVMGYSLGGAFTSYTLIFDNDLVTSDPFQPCISFNSPGIIKTAHKRWNDIKSENRPLYLNFISKNDIISKYGHLIGNKYKLIPKKKKMFIHAHTALMIGENEFTLVEE